MVKFLSLVSILSFILAICFAVIYFLIQSYAERPDLEAVYRNLSLAFVWAAVIAAGISLVLNKDKHGHKIER